MWVIGEIIKDEQVRLIEKAILMRFESRPKNEEKQMTNGLS